MHDDAERLDRALAQPRPQVDEVPARLLELVTLAGEVAEALVAPRLSSADRQRLYARIMSGVQPRRPSLLRRARTFGTRPEVIGAAAAVAAATATAIAVAVLRGRAQQGAPATA